MAQIIPIYKEYDVSSLILFQKGHPQSYEGEGIDSNL